MDLVEVMFASDIVFSLWSSYWRCSVYQQFRGYMKLKKVSFCGLSLSLLFALFNGLVSSVLQKSQLLLLFAIKKNSLHQSHHTHILMHKLQPSLELWKPGRFRYWRGLSAATMLTVSMSCVLCHLCSLGTNIPDWSQRTQLSVPAIYHKMKSTIIRPSIPKFLSHLKVR